MDSILLLNAKYSREVYWMLKIKKQIVKERIEGDANEKAVLAFL